MIAQTTPHEDLVLPRERAEIDEAKAAIDRAAARCEDAFVGLSKSLDDLHDNLTILATGVSALRELARPVLAQARDLSPEAKRTADEITAALERIAGGQVA
jgi:outer membrane protein TolC